MPSSTCWPRRLSAQSWLEATFCALNTSAWSARLNTLRRPTQAPRLVETVTSGEVVMILAPSSPSSRASSPMIRPNASWVEARAARRPIASCAGTGTTAASWLSVRLANGTLGAELLELLGIDVEAGEALPLAALGDAVRLLERRHLVRRHQPGVVVLVAGERQAEALDGIGDEAVRPVVRDAVEGLEHGLQVVAAEVGHQPRQRDVVVLLEQRADAGELAEIALEMLAPGGAALEGDRRVEIVRAVVDPLAERPAVGPRERRLEQLAVLQRHHPPADRAEEVLDLREQPLGHHAIEALAVVVDHPPDVPHVVLPALEQGLEDVALVELGIAHDRDHAPLRLRLRQQPALVQQVLGQGREQRHRRAEPDRAGREVDAVGVLGARRIGLRAAERPKPLELVPRLPPEQVLDRVEHRARMRLDRDAVARPQHVQVERRDQRRDRGAGRLMPADLEPVPARADVVGVMDRPAREPQHLLLERAQILVRAVAARRLGLGSTGKLQHGQRDPGGGGPISGL